MALTRVSKVARTSSSANPITQAVTVAAQDKVVVLLMKVVGATVRAGGSPTFGGTVMTQANTQQIAAASPEASAEIWYVLNPLPGSYTISIPNSGTQSIQFTVESGQPVPGGTVALVGANGANATAANPSPGAVTVTETGCLAWAVVASGATTWAPSAQVGTIIANTDDGNHGGGEQYAANPTPGSFTLSWTFATSEDYGAVVACFKEVSPRGGSNYTAVQAGQGVSVTEASYKG